MPKWVEPERLGTIRSTYQINRLRRPVGIELEVGDWGTITAKVFKHVKYMSAHDASVKPSEREMVLTPMEGDALVSGMVELAEKLYEARAEINDTCALHVHVGATDLSYWEIRRLLMMYARIESDVFKYLVALHRSATPTVVHYCQLLTQPHAKCEKCTKYDSLYPGQQQDLEPLERVLARMTLARSTSDIKVALIRMLYGIEDPAASPDDLAHRKGGKYEWCRYRGLNLHSWLHRGTVEWRMKEGTAEVEELVYWPLFCLHATHAVTRMSDAEAASDRMGLEYLAEKHMPPHVREWVKRKIAAGGSKGSTA